MALEVSVYTPVPAACHLHSTPDPAVIWKTGFPGNVDRHDWRKQSSPITSALLATVPPCHRPGQHFTPLSSFPSCSVALCPLFFFLGTLFPEFVHLPSLLLMSIFPICIPELRRPGSFVILLWNKWCCSLNAQCDVFFFPPKWIEFKAGEWRKGFIVVCQPL